MYHNFEGSLLLYITQFLGPFSVETTHNTQHLLIWYNYFVDGTTSNNLLPISNFCGSNLDTNHKYFEKKKLFRVACRETKQKYRNAATSVSTTAPSTQEHPNGDVFSFEEKLENIKNVLVEWMEDGEDQTGRLIFVDTIQRLGVAHLYEKEIKNIMKQQYLEERSYANLQHAALSFRLLRQRGYHVSADVFNNFKGKDGKFRGQIRQDIWGLMELYEAAHLSFQGENILDEARDFSVPLLHEHVVADVDSNLCNIVKMRLRHPYHKTLARMMNISMQCLHQVPSLTTLVELSELEFLKSKHIHNAELNHVTKWWGDLGLSKELKMARNQPLKWYAWSMAILIDDLSLSEQRVQLTKSIAFIYLIDDIFDLYGSLDELTIFTEAVNKWDYAAMEMLPDYMKLCYKSLLDTTNEIAQTIFHNHGYNPINSLKQTWGSLCDAFLVEAKWFASRDLPGSEEYLVNGKVSSGVHVLVHLFFLLGLGGRTNLDDISTLVSSVAAILRLWDDLGSAKDEHQDGKDGSYVECYMRDHPGIPFNVAREHVVGMIETEWKRLNEECFNLRNQSLASHEFEEGALNMARMVPLMYSYDDNQQLSFLEEYVRLMLQDLAH